ncbi:MAG: hypothetical protein HYY63_00460 [Elusimicrobia bacterium]|nr:hypothetical protein [Elusimicrobiota bacterium]
MRPLVPFILILFLTAGAASSLSGKEKNNLLRKTKERVGGVTKKLAEPITDPKAAFSYWFDFDPRIERGEKKNRNILPLIVSSPERGFGLGLKYAQESLWNKKDVVRVQMIQTLKSKSSYQLKYQFPPNVFTRIGGEPIRTGERKRIRAGTL